MITRLADVLYWTACGLAVLLIGVIFWDFKPGDVSLFGGAALIVWLIGLGLRYVLSGKGVMP